MTEITALTESRDVPRGDAHGEPEHQAGAGLAETVPSEDWPLPGALFSPATSGLAPPPRPTPSYLRVLPGRKPRGPKGAPARRAETLGRWDAARRQSPGFFRWHRHEKEHAQLSLRLDRVCSARFISSRALPGAGRSPPERDNATSRPSRGTTAALAGDLRLLVDREPSSSRRSTTTPPRPTSGLTAAVRLSVTRWPTRQGFWEGACAVFT